MWLALLILVAVLVVSVSGIAWVRSKRTGPEEPQWDQTDEVEAPDSKADHPSQGTSHVAEELPWASLTEEEFYSEIEAILDATPDDPPVELYEEAIEIVGDDPEVHRQIEVVAEAIEEMGDPTPEPMVWKKWNK